MHKRLKLTIATAVAAVAAAGGGLFAATAGAASGEPVTTPRAADGFFGCIGPGNHLLDGQIFPINDWKAEQCPAGNTLYEWPSTLGTTATGTTSVTGWPENGGWATDAFTRTVTVQRHSAVDAAKCGPTAKACWFYTGTLSDNGTFVTVEGAKTPNGGDGDARISGIVHGSMNGGAGVQFYASSAAPDGSLVPATQDGTGEFTTSTWVQQLFPKGTVFGGMSLPAYSWTYAATAPAICEQWVDAINPGDDGASAADGNITGANACTE